ncbi:hypothetical protein [Streptomyces sp. NPDC058335]|uniref:hypothetical protein n=1 Tax=Streptomyces sp. NPDC058335 TaxID=3346451 RepID=UPI003651D003
MSGHPGGFDVVHSVFGALDFADPHLLLPAVGRGQRPGGLLAFSTLAPDVRHPPPPAARRRPAQDTTVWPQFLDRHGSDLTATDTLQDPDDHARPASQTFTGPYDAEGADVSAPSGRLSGPYGCGRSRRGGSARPGPWTA